MILQTSRRGFFLAVASAALAMVVSSGWAAPAAGDAAPGLTFHVSPTGNDQWSGKLAAANDAKNDGPFQTLPRALEAVRNARTAEKASCPITVLVREGTYFLTEPLKLTSEHSGTAEGPTTIAAYPGEHPRVSGGRRITGWKQDADGLWKVDIPDVKSGAWYFRQLWVNGQRRNRPHLPRKEIYHLAGGAAPENSAFRYGPDHIRADWSNRGDIEVVVLQYWMASRLHIAKVDERDRIVTFTGGGWRPLTWSMGYYVENVAEAGCEPGEWYLNRATGVLAYRPMPGEDMAQAEIIAPRTGELCRLDGDVDHGAWVEHVALRGLRFAHCAWPLPAEGLSYPQADLPVGAAIGAQGVRNCTLDECEIAHCDSCGIELGRGCQENCLTRNTLDDLGASGIKIGQSECPAKPADATGHTLIADNTLRAGAQTYFSACGIWIGQSDYNTISHNEIQGEWQFAISTGWRWGYFPPQAARNNIIEYNHVHHIGVRQLGSHSSIYALGIQPGTVIRNNVVHHGAGYGIAIDQAGTGILVENNLVYRNGFGLHFNYHCLGNIVQNNIFAFNGAAQWTRYGDAPPPGEDATLNVLQRNIVCWNGGRLWAEAKWASYLMVIDYNLYYDASGQPVTFLGDSLDQWRHKGPWLDQQSVIANPQFTDPDHDNYTLKPDSPALKLGFQPFDPTKAGPRPR